MFCADRVYSLHYVAEQLGHSNQDECLAELHRLRCPIIALEKKRLVSGKTLIEKLESQPKVAKNPSRQRKSLAQSRSATGRFVSTRERCSDCGQPTTKGRCHACA